MAATYWHQATEHRNTIERRRAQECDDLRRRLTRVVCGRRGCQPLAGAGLVRFGALQSLTSEGYDMVSKNTICLGFNGTALEAAQFYAATFPDSAVTAVHRAPGDYP